MSAAEDYDRAIAKVEEVGRHDVLPHDADMGSGSRLVTALWVPREAGPQAAQTAAIGRKLTARIHALLDDAAPATGLRSMPQADPAARLNASEVVFDRCFIPESTVWSVLSGRARRWCSRR